MQARQSMSMLSAGLLIAVAASTGYAQLSFDVVDTTPLGRFGPADPVHGYPMWLEDANGTVLELCLDTNDVTPPPIPDPETGFPFPPCPACVDPLLDLPDPTLPQSFPDNFPDEHFYWLGESIMIEPDNTRAIVTMALEGAFDGLGTVVDGEQIVFVRYRVRIDNATPGETIKITYPFGVTTTVAENDQAGAAISNVNFTNDIFLWKGVPLKDPLSAIQGTFLESVVIDPATGAVTPVIDMLDPPGTYIGDFCGGGPVTGSPIMIQDPISQNPDGSLNYGTPQPANFFRVEGPGVGVMGDGTPSVHQCANILLGPDPTSYADCIQSEDFTVLAKKATKIGAQLDRATYSRDTLTTQISAWASTAPGQQLQVSGLGIPTTDMIGDGTGHYFAHIVEPATTAPPATLTITNLSDTPPTESTRLLVDNVNILDATYNLDAHALSVSAKASRTDATAGLSLGGSMNGTALDAAAGSVSVTTYVPPATVRVQSSAGGYTEVPVTVFGSVPILLANAGVDQIVMKGATVNLDAAGTVGFLQSYLWTQVGGPDVSASLTGATTATPSFTFPAGDALITFELQVTDTLGSVSTDQIDITNPVVANAGADVVLSVFPDGAAVPLDAITLSEGAARNYTWAQVQTPPAGQPVDPTAPLTDPAGTLVDPADPTLPGDALGDPVLLFPLEGGTVTYQVTVAGAVAQTSVDYISITAPVGAPVANAGLDQTVLSDQIVQLDASDTLGVIDTYAWTQTAGEAVVLGVLQPDGSIMGDGTGTVNPAFVFPATPQTLTFQLTATGPGGSSVDYVDVIVSDPGTSDQLFQNKAIWRENKDRWRISGTSDQINGQTVTAWLGDPQTGILIGSGVVDAIGDWQITVIGGVNPLLHTEFTTVTVLSTGGGVITDWVFEIK